MEGFASRGDAPGTGNDASGAEELPDSDSLRVHIHGLRAVVDKPFDSPYIQTRHGIGYRIAAPDASS
jgi:Response regulators consisting of a CheY-like receiver domain and a winged-helix DNA-binding domain